jgi:WD40-like Beta Propeller Repeat
MPEAGLQLEPVRPGRQNRLRIALAVTLLGGVVVLAGLTRLGVFGDQGRPAALESAAPSAVDVVPSSAASAEPSVPAPITVPIVPVAPTSPALIASVDDNGVLWTMDDGGGSRVTYPAPGVTFGFPAWSPDGRRVAVVGLDANGGGIYVFDVPNAGAVNLDGRPNPGQTEGPDPTVIYWSQVAVPFYLYWMPDGRGIGFLAGEAIGLSLRVVPADGNSPIDGTAPGAVVRTGAPLYFDWLDPSRLLVHLGVGSTAFTGTVGLDGKRIGTALSGTGDFRSPSHSPDGRYVAFVRTGTGGSQQVVVARQDGTVSHQLKVFGPAAFAFDPAGSTLAVLAPTSPVSQDQPFPVGPIRLIDPASGAGRTLLSRPAIAFFWSPDGRSIAAILPSQPGDDQLSAWRATLTGSVGPPKSAGPQDQAPGVTARIAFVDVKTGVIGSDRVIHLADQFVGQLLPYFDQYDRSHHLWSPDSTSILLPLDDPTGTDLEVAVPADGSAARTVTGGANGFWSP